MLLSDFLVFVFEQGGNLEKTLITKIDQSFKFFFVMVVCGRVKLIVIRDR